MEIISQLQENIINIVNPPKCQKPTRIECVKLINYEFNKFRDELDRFKRYFEPLNKETHARAE